MILRTSARHNAPRSRRGRAGQAPSLLPVVLLLALAAPLSAAVVISEIMYNPRQGDQYEYIELYNEGTAAADLTGWAFADGVVLPLPAGRILEPGAYLIVCESVAFLRGAYPSLPEAVIVGGWQGNLDDGGERIALVDPLGGIRQAVEYGDEAPWEFLADGYGASLERVCLRADPGSPDNWRASLIPEDPATFGGSPAGAAFAPECPPPPHERPPIVISEIMYHPVWEDGVVEAHEFVEIVNAGETPVDISGWRLAGDLGLSMPQDRVLAPGGFFVLARSRNHLLRVPGYAIDAAQIIGNYQGSLSNGRGRVGLADAAGHGIDAVHYDDQLPWPSAPDALGAEEDFLPDALKPLSQHQYRGCSLERVSADHPSDEAANWVSSPVDGATPGRANAGARASPLPVVDAIVVQDSAARDPLIRNTDPVRIEVSFTPAPPVGAVHLEHFVDDVAAAGEPVTRVELADDGATGGDRVAADGVFTATLPPQPDNSIVRYQVLADRGAGLERVAPRADDPQQPYAYFVQPLIETQTVLYQLFISPQDWGQMWANIESGRVFGCAANPNWDAQVPAVFVHDGHVYDARVRYQGSRWNRTGGPAASSWPYPGPAYGPNPPQGLSWRIKLPRYDTLPGREVLILNKLTQACPGLTAGIGHRLFEMADLPAPKAQYVRFHINGGYYRYMMDYERPGAEMMERYHREQAARAPGKPVEQVGHLYKSVGFTGDEGPWGWGDERRLTDSCGYPAAERYAATYERKTYERAGYTTLIQLIEDLNTARAGGTAAMREYFERNYDIDLLLNYMAVINWSVPFDDMFQNHFLYQRLSDGKWIVTPWDLDLNFGGWKGPRSSLYMGEQGDPDNRSGWWNYLKDAFLKSYRSEYEARLLLLNNTLLHPDVVNALIDEVAASANPAEAQAAATPVSCDYGSAVNGFRSFAAERHRWVNDQLAAAQVDAGPDMTVFAGTTVQFDASASRPDPGPDVQYLWSNGMQGERPTCVFPEPGVYTLTLSVIVSDVPFTDSIVVTVVPLPETAFCEIGGEIAIEAESFAVNDRHGHASAQWEPATSGPPFSGAAYMLARSNGYDKFSANYASVAPELRYPILFGHAGEYQVWLRGLSPSSAADSCHVGLDGNARDESYATRFTINANAFLWSGDSRSQGAQIVTVNEPGLHVLSLWIRETGQGIDKIVLRPSGGAAPTGVGPPESAVFAFSLLDSFAILEAEPYAGSTHLRWTGLGPGWKYTVERSDGEGSDWLPVAPATQWPTSATEWAGPDSATHALYRLRAEFLGE